MSTPLLVILSGPPCSGKTTLGQRLADQLRLPFIYKDGIKELLFDRLGWSDLQWSKQLSLASYDLMYFFLEAQLRAGISSIVEANFRAEEHTNRFLGLKSRYPFEPVQILCYTDGEVLLERFRRRASSSGTTGYSGTAVPSGRHPGHLDLQQEENLRQVLLSGRHEPLEIGGRVLEIDTTDFDAIDYPGLFNLFEGLEGFS